MKIVVRRRSTPPPWLIELALEEATKPAGVTIRELAKRSGQPHILCAKAMCTHMRGPGAPGRVASVYEPFKGGPADPIQVARYTLPPNPEV